jgi:hypothetical protein
MGKSVVQIEVFDVYADRPCSWGGDHLTVTKTAALGWVGLLLSVIYYNSHNGRSCVGGRSCLRRKVQVLLLLVSWVCCGHQCILGARSVSRFHYSW